MRFSIVLFAVLLSASVLYSETTYIVVDSLEQALLFTDDHRLQIQLNNEIAGIYVLENPEKSLKYSTIAHELASIHGNNKQKAIALYYQGVALFKLFQKPNAIEALIAAKEIFKRLDEKIWIAEVSIELGRAYQMSLAFEKALTEFLDGLSIVKEMELEDKVARFLNYIGGVYYDQNEINNAFDYFKQSMIIWEKLDNSAGMAVQYNNIGEMYRLKGEYQLALSFYKKAVEINEQIPNYINLCINYDNIGNVFLSLEQFDSTRFYFNKSLEITELVNKPELISTVNNSIGLLYFRIDKDDLAINHFQRAYKISHKQGLSEGLKVSAYGLSNVYASNKDYKKALYYHKEFKALNDSIVNIYNSSKITEIEQQLKYENERKIDEIEQQRTRFIYILFALGLIGFIIVLIMFYGRLKINIRHSKSKAVNLYLENKHLEEDIDYKNRELATIVMYLLKINELINYISNKLLRAKTKFKSQNQPIVEEILMDLQSNISSEVWSEFEKRFQAVHKGFYNKLNMKFPNLTDADKKLCALLKLNMSTKEIAAVSHQNLNTVEVARTRLRKKMGLSNKDIGLVSFISNL